MELLAPAGDPSALRAAVCAGADAVYLGMRSFSARATAGNFDEEELAVAVAYAHLYHVRVYVTMNTLAKEREMDAAHRALMTIANARADGIIVQDMGVAAMALAYFPTLALHASTQMAIHNATGASWAKAQGFQRVVLARECSMEEICKAARSGIEIETFVHGALCAGVSGQCLLSSMAGGRSGNRGRCAQPCRQKVSLGDSQAALLSMKDLCLRDHLPELQAAGVTSLKIEGRLKRPEYVAIVTESYRRALDALQRGDFRPGDEIEKENLKQIFHRGGFTLGHAMGAQDADLCAIEHVGHGGISVGRIVDVKGGLATVALDKPLHGDDGLQIRRPGNEAYDLRYSGKEKDGGEEAILRLRPDAAISKGDEVFRLTDAAQMKKAESTQREKPIPISMDATIQIGKPLSLNLSDGTSQVTVWGEAAQEAKNRPTTAEEAYKQLAKLGNTPFELKSEESLAIAMQEGAFIPVSALNELRRNGMQALIRARVAAFFGEEKETVLMDAASKRPAEKNSSCQKNGDVSNVPKDIRVSQSSHPSLANKLVIRFVDADMAAKFQALGVDLLLFAPQDMTENGLETALAKLPGETWLELPPQLTQNGLEIALKAIKRHEENLSGVVLGSIGQLGAAFPVPVALGSGIPLMNRAALEAMKKADPAFWIIWPELSLSEMKEMQPFAIPALLAVYGRERLMLLNHCPFRVLKENAANRKDCRRCPNEQTACGEKDAALIDRKGFRFPLQRTVMSEGCLVNVLGALPTDLRRQEKARKSLGAGMLVSFTIESAEEQLRIAGEFAAIAKGEAPAIHSEVQTTQGHFFRGVE